MQWIQQIKRQIAQIARREINLIYPPQCACCQAELEETEDAFDLCGECQKRLIPTIWIPCPRCGAMVSSVHSDLGGCSFCWNTQFHFESVTALGGYHTSFKPVVSRMKRRSGAALSLAMGKHLGLRRREMLEKVRPDLIIPIPMYWWHRVRRGVNNPELIACELGKTLGIPFRRWLLVRCKKTLTQSLLPPEKRFSNVKGAFRVRFERKIRNRRILLVDDVLTTGATCSEAARVLKQAGAAMVAVAVVARAQGEPK